MKKNNNNLSTMLNEAYNKSNLTRPSNKTEFLKAGIVATFLVMMNFAVTAQPVIDEVYTIGDRFTFIEVEPNEVEAGVAGEDVTWDFSNLTATSDTFFLDIIHPDSTDHGDNFPEATHVEKGSDGSYGFIKVTDSESLIVGVYDETENLLIDYTTPLLFSKHLFTFGDSLSAVGRRTYSTSGETFDGTGFVNSVADGWGTLVLPNGTYDNVLRLNIDHNYKDTGRTTGMVSETNVKSYYWFAEDRANALLTIDSIHVSVPGFEMVIENVRYQHETVTNIKTEWHSDAPELSGYLAHGQLHLLYPFAGNENVTVNMWDLQGRKISSVSHEQQGASERIAFPMDMQNNQLYLYQVIVKNNEEVKSKVFMFPAK